MKNSRLKYLILGVLFIVMIYIFKNQLTNYPTNSRVDNECECAKIKARKDIKLGNLIAFYNPRSPYFEEIAYEYGVITKSISPTAKRNCAIAIMDSFINKKFGSSFFENIEKKADSLNIRRPFKGFLLDSTSIYFEEGPKYKKGGIAMIQNEIIKKLYEDKILPIKLNECSPNELIIDLKINKKGIVENIRILKKFNNTIDNYVVSYFKNLNDSWVPAKIGGKYVDSRKKITFYFGKEAPRANDIE